MTTRVDRHDLPVLGAMALTIVLLHLAGVLLLVVAAGQHLRLTEGGVYGLGLGLTAYTLGMRHAFDADHIAAIDNSTRKLVGDGGRPLSVGFWFSLGHSTVVVGLCVLVAFGMRSVMRQVEDGGSLLQSLASVLGSSVAGGFLLLIGLINLVALVRIAGLFRLMRAGSFDDDALEAELDRRGVMARVLRPLIRAVRRPLHLYPVGLLFGLGLDTATEVSLLALAGGAALTLPWYAIMSLPLLFAAGMCLFDTIDGVFMRTAYGWAFDRPVRKVYYNLTVTALSAAVALVIGGIVVVGLVAERTGIDGGPLGFVADLDLGLAGYAIVVLFVLAWVVSTLAWKVFRIEERWVRPTGSVS
jgi:high-affinity nickel-transport protein